MKRKISREEIQREWKYIEIKIKADSEFKKYKIDKIKTERDDKIRQRKNRNAIQHKERKKVQKGKEENWNTLKIYNSNNF